MKIDAGAHNLLFRAGMKVYRLSPTLYDNTIKALQLPGTLRAKMGPKKPVEIGGRIGLVNLELTVVCNLRCTMCWWWGDNGIAFKMFDNKDPMVTKPLATEEIFRVIDQVSRDKPTFYLSGGEPFWRRTP